MKDRMRLSHWRGLPSLWIFNREGECVLHEVDENLIVTSAIDIARHSLAGSSDHFVTKIALGNDATPPVLADGTIGGIATASLIAGNNGATPDAFLTTLTSYAYPGANDVTFVWDVGFTEANGLSFAEMGLLSENLTLLARKVRTPIDKDSTIRLHGEWTITLS